MSGIQFKKGTKAHLVGIKGVGMTALAAVLRSRGVKVTGSDTSEKFFTDAVLRKLKIPVQEKFASENIPADVDVVISSTAYYFDSRAMNSNPEVIHAISKGILILTYPQALGILSKEYKVIAVAGSHGKSTTTALLGWVMEHGRLDPNVIVGTRVNHWNSNARIGQSDYLVVEADEYREAFLHYRPFMTIITSIDYDHPDYFKTKEDYFKAFEKLANNTEKFLIVYGDDPQLQRLAASGKKRGLKVCTYGFSKTNDLVLQETGVKHSQMFHATISPLSALSSKLSANFAIPFSGKPYILNSGAVVLTAQFLGVPMPKIQSAIKTFPGTARRLEIVKQTQNYTIIDDYAHHPTAIRLTLEGVKQKYPDKKIVVIFQPHMFSRTQALLNDFAESFSAADEVGIMEVYPSARETSGPVGGQELFEATQKNHPQVTFLKDFDSAKQFVKQYRNSGNIIVLMGAGNVRDVAP